MNWPLHIYRRDLRQCTRWPVELIVSEKSRGDGNDLYGKNVDNASLGTFGRKQRGMMKLMAFYRKTKEKSKTKIYTFFKKERRQPQNGSRVSPCFFFSCVLNPHFFLSFFHSFVLSLHTLCKVVGRPPFRYSMASIYQRLSIKNEPVNFIKSYMNRKVH